VTKQQIGVKRLKLKNSYNLRGLSLGADVYFICYLIYIFLVPLTISMKGN